PAQPGPVDGLLDKLVPGLPDKLPDLGPLKLGSRDPRAPAGGPGSDAADRNLLDYLLGP
ncbi:MAG: hypothetical protein H0T43_02610, partial [Solirubrobacterales bacterium]|nr:hypothetical protein [Solirubrobacterales bacterium]